jgi:hypothetical protein
VERQVGVGSKWDMPGNLVDLLLLMLCHVLHSHLRH